MKKLNFIACVICGIFLGQSLWAQKVSVRAQVLPPQIGSFSWLNTGQDGTRQSASGFNVFITPTCFPSNLRVVQHPVQVNSRLRLVFGYYDNSNNLHDVVVEYPAWIHFGGFPGELLDSSTPMPKTVTAACASCPAPPRAFAFQGSLVVRLAGVKSFTPDPVTSEFNFPASGTGASNVANFLQFREISQTPQGTDQRLPVSLKREAEMSSDFKSASISLNVAGGDGFRNLWHHEVVAMINQGLNPCFSYESPLMLFFDEGLPRFSSKVSFRFQRDQGSRKYFWPEKGSPGYFLALDRNANGRIDDGDELFGNHDSSANGFHVLRQHDSNKDGVINSKDPVFSKLLLWKDNNSDGISQASELVRLADKKVQAIYLNYERRVIKIGRRAEVRQSAKFEFSDKKGETQAGDIHDVWFAPASP